ncbi:MAG: HAD-IIIC family phosphatase [Desulfovibrio sp.]
MFPHNSAEGSIEKSSTQFNITVLRNVMVDPLAPFLKEKLTELNLTADIKFGEYDNIVQEALTNDELFNETDCIVVFLKLEQVSWNIARNFNSLDNESRTAEVKRLSELVETVVAAIREKSKAMILFSSFELPDTAALGVIDITSATGQLATIKQLNDNICSTLNAVPNAYLLDMNQCLMRLGTTEYYDMRFWHLGKNPYSRKTYQELAFEISKYIRPLNGLNKKCIVLDCDNTLWGGIIGEDRMDGIKISKDYPGSHYYEFQQEILELYNRGIILALNSKNNEEDVLEVFNDHPDMQLRMDNIATYQVNWNDKASNLRTIAEDLNIGLDSIVFIDDSEFEINLVQQELPEVTTIHLDSQQSAGHRNMLRTCGLFDTLTLSDEDKIRGQMYKAEAQRKTLKAKQTDLGSYYLSLEMSTETNLADDFSIPRLAQMTQKTNQFNLTTKRYSESDISSYAYSETSDVIYLTLKDKFGDYGIIGLCIMQWEKEIATIDSLLLSCRALGRKVEDIFMADIVRFAQNHGCTAINAKYIKTKKNSQVADFYTQFSFERFAYNADTTDASYTLDISKAAPSYPEFFKEMKYNLDR